MKKLAALEAVKHVKSGMTLGLGTGSTAKHAIIEIGRLIQEHKLMDVVAVATSLESEKLALELESALIPITSAPSSRNLPMLSRKSQASRVHPGVSSFG